MNKFSLSAIIVFVYLVFLIIIYLVHCTPKYLSPKTPYTAKTASLDVIKKVGQDHIDLIKEKSGFLEPYNADVMKACEKSLAKSTTYSQAATSFFLTPNNIIGTLPLSKLASPKDTLLFQFEQGILGWYWGYLTFEKPYYNVMFYVIRSDIGTPAVREKYNLPLGATTMYSVSVGVGHGPKTWQYSPHIITSGTYNAISDSKFNFSCKGSWGKLVFAGDGSNFSLVFNITSSANNNQPFSASCKLLQSNIGPSFNAPNGCAPCFGGAGSLYWSYTQLDASILKMSINNKAIITTLVTGGDGWMDRQWVRPGNLSPLLPRLINNVFGFITTAAGQIGRYMWLNIHLRDPEIQYMIVALLSSSVKIKKGESFPTGYQIYSKGNVIAKKGTVQIDETMIMKNSGEGMVTFPTKVSVTVEDVEGKSHSYILDSAPYGNCVTIDFSGNLHWSGSAVLNTPGTAFMEFNQFQELKDYKSTTMTLAGIPNSELSTFMEPLSFWQTFPSGLLLLLAPILLITLIVLIIVGFVKK